MRSASRVPGKPVSTNRDCPDGETNRVDCPPSTSTKYMSSAVRCRASTTEHDKTTVVTRNTILLRITPSYRRVGTLHTSTERFSSDRRILSALHTQHKTCQALLADILPLAHKPGALVWQGHKRRR